MADFLQLRDGVAGAEVPVEKIDILHEANSVGGESKAQSHLHRPAPHVIARITQVGRQVAGNLPM